LAGTDAYRLLQKRKEITDLYIEKHGNASRESFDASESGSLQLLRQRIGMRSMFSEKKFVIIDRIEESEDEKELIKLLKENAETEDVVILAVDPKKPTAKFSFLIKKPFVSQVFEALKGKELEAFVLQEAKRKNVPFSLRAAKDLISAFGDNTWAIATELDVLALVHSGREFPHKKEGNYFGLASKLRSRVREERIVALERLLSEHKEDAARIFNGLAYRIPNAATARLYADYDEAVKKGALEYEEILTALAVGD